jgi:hypothetical protein
MPNWCSNVVEVSHPDRRKIVELRRAFRKGQMCNYILPVPQDLKDTMAGSYGDGDKQAALEAQTKRNVEKYGYGNWYDFCVGNWGTKWDVGDRGGDTRNDANSLTLTFDSAWSPPMGIFEKMVDEGYEVVAYYYEPGMGYVGKYDNGSDECIEYSGETSKTVRDAIGDELDDMFAISESMAEYEDDNEELTEWIKDGVEKRNLETL